MEFLEKCSEMFYIIVYSNSNKNYAAKVVNCIDPERKFIKRVLHDKYITKFPYSKGVFHIKDLRIFENILDKTIIVDDEVSGFAFHLENGLPITPFNGSPNDEELVVLINYLTNILPKKANYLGKDIVSINKKYTKLHICLVKMRASDAQFNYNLTTKAFTSSGESVSNKDFFKPNYFSAHEWDATKSIDSAENLIKPYNLEFLQDN